MGGCIGRAAKASGRRDGDRAGGACGYDDGTVQSSAVLRTASDKESEHTEHTVQDGQGELAGVLATPVMEPAGGKIQLQRDRRLWP